MRKVVLQTKVRDVKSSDFFLCSRDAFVTFSSQDLSFLDIKSSGCNPKSRYY